MAEKKQAKAKTVFYRGTGRRKTAVARVRISEGNGQVSINGRGLEDYFTETKDRSAVVGPLNATGLRAKINITATVIGGGFTGQAGAVSQGVARAIKIMFGGEIEEAPKPVVAAVGVDGQAAAPAPAAAAENEGSIGKRLRDSGFLTRDGRMKERKKYGRKGARRSFQFSKR